jgi:hypothetical protein
VQTFVVEEFLDGYEVQPLFLFFRKRTLGYLYYFYFGIRWTSISLLSYQKAVTALLPVLAALATDSERGMRRTCMHTFLTQGRCMASCLAGFTAIILYYVTPLLAVAFATDSERGMRWTLIS